MSETLIQHIQEAVNASEPEWSKLELAQHIHDTLLAAGFRRLDPLEAEAVEEDTEAGARFAIQVRTVFGPYREQVVRAADLTKALIKAESIPLSEWVGDE